MAFGLPDITKELSHFLALLERMANTLDRIETKLDEQARQNA